MTAAKRRASSTAPDGAPFRDSYREAFDLWCVGKFPESLAILDASEPQTPTERANRELLRARSLLRIEEYAEALRAAKSVGFDMDVDRVATALMLQSSALTYLKRHDEASELVNVAAGLPTTFRTIQAEIALQQALLYFVRRDLAKAREFAVKAIAKADDIVLARAQELLAYVNSGEEKFLDAKRSFRQALATLLSTDRRDAFVEANVFWQAASMSAELLDHQDVSSLDAAFKRLLWPADRRGFRFQCLQQLGWLHFTNADYPEAWALFTEAVRTLPEDEKAHRITGLVNLATFHRMNGEPRAGRLHIRAAASEIARVDWTGTDSDRRAAALEYVIEAARLDEPVSMDLLRDYDALPPRSGSKAFDREDRRILAVSLTAKGLVVAQSDAQRGIVVLDQALEIFLKIGYVMRASLVALDLYKLADRPEYLEIARTQTRANRGSFLSERLVTAAKSERLGLAILTPTERKYMDEIVQGRSNSAIAATHGVTEQTVKNAIRSILNKMNASSRSELIVLGVELGLVGSSRDEAPIRSRSRS